MKKYEKLAQDIIDNVGGKDNVKGLSHCVTRLRFRLKDSNKANTDIIEAMDGVVTVMESGGQYQVVIGNHVSEVYEEVAPLLGLEQKQEEESSTNLFDIISGIFQPSLGVLAASGMTKGFLALAVYLNMLSPTDGAYLILNAIADAIFAFFPIILGYNASKKFNMNPYIAMIIGGALVYPGINQLGSGEVLYTLFAGTIFESPVFYTFFGIPVIFPVTTYGSTVIPIIFAVFIGSKIEKVVRKFTPSVVRTFLVPFFTLLITVPLTFIIIGPIANMLSALIGEVILKGFSFSPILAGLVLGAVWQLLVIFGLHWGVVSIAIMIIGEFGFETLLPIIVPVSFAQTAVIAAIALKTKDSALRSLSIPSIISGIFGVTEPAIYGITLPRIKMFAISCIGGGLGGAYVGFMGLKAYGVGAMGVFALPQMMSVDNADLTGLTQMLIAIAIASIFSFVAAYILYKDEETPEIKKTETLNKTLEVKSMISGDVIKLSDVKDGAFAKGALGKGLAILPDKGEVFAPFDGQVSVLFPSKHAIGLTSKDGLEILIHVGMDTVMLEGKHFTSHVEQGQSVSKGDHLLSFDIEAIKDAGYSLETPIIVTNSDDYFEIIETNETKVDVMDPVLTVLY